MNKELIEVINKLIKKTEVLDKEFTTQIKSIDSLAKDNEDYVEYIGRDNLYDFFGTLDSCKECLTEVIDRLTELKKTN